MADTTARPAEDPHGLVEIIDRVMALADSERVSVRDVIEGFGSASFLPFLLIPALIVVSPLSGIPLLPSALGLTIALIAAQMLLNRNHLWLPGFITRREIAGERLRANLQRLHKAAEWIDRHSRRRLTWLVHPPMSVLPRMLCVVCGGLMPFLELVPFSSSILATAVVLFSVGFLARDGLFTLAGMGLVALGASIPLKIFG